MFPCIWNRTFSELNPIRNFLSRSRSTPPGDRNRSLFISPPTLFPASIPSIQVLLPPSLLPSYHSSGFPPGSSIPETATHIFIITLSLNSVKMRLLLNQSTLACKQSRDITFAALISDPNPDCNPNHYPNHYPESYLD